MMYFVVEPETKSLKMYNGSEAFQDAFPKVEMDEGDADSYDLFNEYKKILSHELWIAEEMIELLKKGFAQENVRKLGRSTMKRKLITVSNTGVGDKQYHIKNNDCVLEIAVVPMSEFFDTTFTYLSHYELKEINERWGAVHA